ncbi:hypothetical protein HYC85_006106 [Camellia sinensis]|uniref:Uncharacterized protein n=1 Tax=Camellia sinensis TaxID=4442 RepID=A0A7J7I2U6_CAMSI|nr:hypothetical protein HYC85_006106 [Camellia sinensis]
MFGPSLLGRDDRLPTRVPWVARVARWEMSYVHRPTCLELGSVEMLSSSAVMELGEWSTQARHAARSWKAERGFPPTHSRVAHRRCARRSIGKTRSLNERKSNNGLSSDQNREFLERYGLNPDDFLSKPSPKTRRKELRKTGRGKQVPPEEPKPPRETHKLLQVLGGTAKRKKLLSPKGMDVRPMMEVVKGAAFDILQAAGGCPASLRPGRWLDLYSGTGSVGIEALSRGCSENDFVVFDERAKDNDHNLPTMTFITRDYRFFTPSPVHHFSIDLFLSSYDLKTEVYILIETLQLMNCFCVGKDGPFDYISVTPPYTEVDYGVLMDQVSKSSVVGEDTFIVVEYPLRTDMLDSCGCLIKISDRRFGRTHLAIYGPKWAQKKRKSEKSIWALAEKV